MRKNTIVDIISGLLIMLFLYASFSKFFNFSEFYGDMHNQPFPGWLATILVFIVPTLEVLIAFFLMTERYRVSGLYLSLALMSAFTIYTGIVLLHFFSYIPCSCGGVIKKLTWGQHLILNLFFVVISTAGIYITKKQSPVNHNRKLALS